MMVYPFPLAVDALRCDGGVGVGSTQLDSVVLGDFLHLRLDGLDGLSLLVGIWQSGLELLMSCDQTLREGKRFSLTSTQQKIFQKQFNLLPLQCCIHL